MSASSLFAKMQVDETRAGSIGMTTLPGTGRGLA